MLTVILGSTPRADAKVFERIEGLVDANIGVSIPVGDSNWNKFADPTFKLSLVGGAELWLNRRFGVAPYLQLDFIPVSKVPQPVRGSFPAAPQFVWRTPDQSTADW